MGLVGSMFHNVRVLPVTDSELAAGEASDVSTISMDGVRAADGGSLGYNGLGGSGFGINRHGSDGFITSTSPVIPLLLTGSGEELSSVERFDQTTNTVTGTIASTQSSAPDLSLLGTLNSGSAGVFHEDVGLYQDLRFDIADNVAQAGYHVLDPVAASSTAGSWQPPADYLPPDIQNTGWLLPADNQETDSVVFFSGTLGNASNWQVFSSNIGANTFGPSFDVGAAVSPTDFPWIGGFAQDTAANKGLIAAGLISPKVSTVDLDDGTVTPFAPGPVGGLPAGVAIDSNTGKAVVGTTGGGIGLYDLANASGRSIRLGGFGYYELTVDSARGQFVIWEATPPDFFVRTFSGNRTTINNNANSSIVILTENGEVLKRLEQFNFGGARSGVNGVVQVNPSTGTGYAPGPGGQLEPFTYAGPPESPATPPGPAGRAEGSATR